MSDSEESYEPEYEPEQITIGRKYAGAEKSHNTTYSFEVLSVVPPPLEYMTRLRSDQQEISSRKVWCGSLMLGHALLDMDTDFRQNQDSSILAERSSSPRGILEGKRVLELGSGTGILGMLASKLFPTCMALTDGDPSAIDLLQKNLENPFNEIDAVTVRATALLWGNDVDGQNKSESFSNWCRQTWPGVWNTSEENRTKTVDFDVILAGDVLYKSELPQLFFETVQIFLRRRDVENDQTNEHEGTLYLNHVPRSTVTHDVVKNAAAEAGFQIEEIPVDLDRLSDDCSSEDAVRAKLYEIKRKHESET